MQTALLRCNNNNIPAAVKCFLSRPRLPAPARVCTTCSRSLCVTAVAASRRRNNNRKNGRRDSSRKDINGVPGRDGDAAYQQQQQQQQYVPYPIDDQDQEGVTLFAVEPFSKMPPPCMEYVRMTVREADRQYSNTSARIEYCRAKGVDYERTVRYMSVVEALEQAMRLLLLPPPPPQ